MIAGLYLEHLTDSDLGLLEAASQRPTVRREPEALLGALDDPAAYRAVFNQPGRDPLFQASPFLLFSLLIHRAARDLTQASFVDEWIGPRQRVPVFDVTGLREFGAEPARRFFLAELLASYTHVASGSVLVQTRRGWRRRRFSELDPLRLIELAELLPEQERPSVYRRLGDLALFLTGIFPDYAAERLVVNRERQQLERALDRGDGSGPKSRTGSGCWSESAAVPTGLPTAPRSAEPS
ncbi:MAG TPA: hypothetical protein VHW91_09490 [Candidatus Dormibacteraeota bacterium]|nr:hypothetical protein [Candidatus Dormibacteraeota bacterium]